MDILTRISQAKDTDTVDAIIRKGIFSIDKKHRNFINRFGESAKRRIRNK